MLDLIWEEINTPTGQQGPLALIDGTDYIGLQTVTGVTRANITNTALASNAAFQCQIAYYTTDPF